ncbi:MAG: Rossmann-like and DUF2520 domain-containing protein [bacterium]
MSRDCRLAVIGAGRVGCAMAFLSREKGYEITGLCCQHPEEAQNAADFLNKRCAAKKAPGLWLRDANLILITTPDDVIGQVCSQIVDSEYIKPGSVIAHCSGAHPSSILKPAADIGCPTGSLHPLQSCATKEMAISLLPGSYFCIEGSEEAKIVLKDLVMSIGGNILEIATDDKPLYHASAAVASNFLIALINFALSLYETIGIEREKGLQALSPLFEGTIRNIKAMGIPEALTGPIMRGDLGTVKAHLEAIKNRTPYYLSLYCALGIETTKIAMLKGTINDKTGNKFEELFDQYLIFSQSYGSID